MSRFIAISATLSALVSAQDETVTVNGLGHLGWDKWTLEDGQVDISTIPESANPPDGRNIGVRLQTYDNFGDKATLNITMNYGLLNEFEGASYDWFRVEPNPERGGSSPAFKILVDTDDENPPFSGTASTLADKSFVFTSNNNGAGGPDDNNRWVSMDLSASTANALVWNETACAISDAAGEPRLACNIDTREWSEECCNFMPARPLSEWLAFEWMGYVGTEGEIKGIELGLGRGEANVHAYVQNVALDFADDSPTENKIFDFQPLSSIRVFDVDGVNGDDLFGTGEPERPFKTLCGAAVHTHTDPTFGPDAIQITQPGPYPGCDFNNRCNIAAVLAGVKVDSNLLCLLSAFLPTDEEEAQSKTVNAARATGTSIRNIGFTDNAKLILTADDDAQTVEEEAILTELSFENGAGLLVDAMSNNAIINVTLSDSTFGPSTSLELGARDSPNLDAEASGLVLTGNSFDAQATAINRFSTPPTVEDNWFGDPSGPSGDGQPGAGTPIEGFPPTESWCDLNNCDTAEPDDSSSSVLWPVIGGIGAVLASFLILMACLKCRKQQDEEPVAAGGVGYGANDKAEPLVGAEHKEGDVESGEASVEYLSM